MVTEDGKKAAAAAPVAAAAAPAPRQEDGPTRLHVGHLTRNVSEAHVAEIFGTYGKLRGVELAIDKQVNLPRCAPCVCLHGGCHNAIPAAAAAATGGLVG
jgi:hypothetical protein